MGKEILVLMVFAIVFLVGGMILYSIGSNIGGEVGQAYTGGGIVSMILGGIFFLLLVVFLIGSVSRGSSGI